MVASEAAFRTRLDLFAGPLFEGLDLTNLVVAGGAVGYAFHIGDTTNARVREKAKDLMCQLDVDLFIVADDEAIARATFDRVYEHLITRIRLGMHDHRQLLILRTALAVSFYAGHPQRTIQIILRRHSCVADVIFGFDVDACQLAYDGKRVLATPSALRAYQTGINIADPERSSPAYEKRLVIRDPRLRGRHTWIGDRPRRKAVQERSLHIHWPIVASPPHPILRRRQHTSLSGRHAGDRRAAKASRSLRTPGVNRKRGHVSTDPIRQQRRKWMAMPPTLSTSRNW